MTACDALDPCNAHGLFMPLVEGFAYLHALVGANLAGLAVLQFGLWFILYAALVNTIAIWTRDSVARWSAGVSSYLLTGLLTLALTFYAITPTMNLIGVSYLTVIWPLWVYGNVGVPEWLAPYLFTFNG